ncbi:hypothetical protein, partial [Novosphingobium guangzhouense]|uniref:hypothetical protein n=1 Tax=Novosphingobium guangzhouense TaxID=1850347 RepID=UPI001B805155
SEGAGSMNEDLCHRRLYRSPYLVIPRLALQAMPDEWQDRLEALLKEADAAGLDCPQYQVFRDDGPGSEYTRARVVNEATGFVRLVRGSDDPWANYKYGDVREICPTFKGGSHA